MMTTTLPTQTKTGSSYYASGPPSNAIERAVAKILRHSKRDMVFQAKEKVGRFTLAKSKVAPRATAIENVALVSSSQKGFSFFTLNLCVHLLINRLHEPVLY